MSKGILTTIQNGKPTTQEYPNINPPPTYSAFYSSFAEAMAGKGDVPVRAEDASQVIRLVELARESSRMGRTVDV